MIFKVNPNYVPKEERDKISEEPSSSERTKYSESSKHSKSSHRHEESSHRHSSSHRSRDKHKHSDKPMEIEDKSKPEVKKKKRPPAPPPMSFNDILKIAEQKKAEPVNNVPEKTKKVCFSFYRIRYLKKHSTSMADSCRTQ